MRTAFIKMNDVSRSVLAESFDESLFSQLNACEQPMLKRFKISHFFTFPLKMQVCNGKNSPNFFNRVCLLSDRIWIKIKIAVPSIYSEHLKRLLIFPFQWQYFFCLFSWKNRRVLRRRKNQLNWNQIQSAKRRVNNEFIFYIFIVPWKIIQLNKLIQELIIFWS